MLHAADKEDETEKDPVTAGEVIPARELLGDMYLDIGQPARALEAYEADLKRRPNRFNALYGAGLAEEKLGNGKALTYYQQLLTIASPSNADRPELLAARLFVADRK